MRILFIAPYVPSRIRVRPFQLIKEIAKRHEVYVLALGGADKAESQGVEELLAVVKDLRVIPHPKLRGYAQSLLSLPTPSPMCTAFCRSRAMNEAVVETLTGTHFDVMYVEHLRAAHFVPRQKNVPVVFDSVDCLTGLFRQMSQSRRNPLARFLMMEEAWKLQRYEPNALARFERTIVTSESERDELLSLDAGLRVQVVPNGVDTGYFAPMGDPRQLKRIIFSGKMSYHPNAQAAVWFAENVFPALKRDFPDAEFVIVGSSPGGGVAALSGQPGISVTGHVEDIRSYLDSSYVAVVPMQVAVGMQNKALEAMAMGLPVVASPAAARAFGKSCPGIVVAETAEETIREVSRLLERPAVASEIGRAGMEEARRMFSWEASGCGLESICEELVK